LIETKCYIHKRISSTNKVYIGTTFSTVDRFRSYKNLKCVEQRRLYNSFVKHGVDKHIFEIICECSANDRYAKEGYYGALYDALGDNGLNCSLPKNENYITVTDETRKKIADKSRGQKRSKETLIKMSQWQIGRKLPESTKEKLSIIASKRKHTEETKKKIGLSGTGKKRSEETRLKISKSNKGRKLSNEHIEFIRKMNTGRKLTSEQRKVLSEIRIGKKHKEETKKKIGIGNKGKVRSKDARKKMSESKSKLILNTENGIFYLGLKEAALSLNVNWNTLSWWLSGFGKNKTSLIYV
jgi:group I intron endonuclease